MSNQNKAINAKEYYEYMHRVGVVILAVSICVFFGVPFIVSLYYGVLPKLSDLVVAAGGLCAVFVPLSIAESFAEIPVMGTSYDVALVTGNVLNLKLPAAMNALKVADLRQGTPQADAVVGIAVSVSSLVTVVMLVIGVLLLTPLQPLLQSEAVTTAASHVLPALFGCLSLGVLGNNVGGGVVIHKRLLAAVVPFVICVILYFLMPDLYEAIQGIIMIICILFIYKISKILYQKGIITVDLPEE